MEDKKLRYVKTKTYEFWIDENDKVRKKIVYHDNGIKWYECYYNEKRERHNEKGYAYKEWDENGNITYQDYCLNNKELTEKEWKEKTGKKEEINVVSSNSPVNYSYGLDKYNISYILT